MKRITFFFLTLAVGATAAASDLTREVNLSGEWLIEIGDHPAYAAANYDDKNWEVIYVPSSWENQGFPGYDGYAWYRRHFVVPAELESKELYLKLGRIDDVDEVFLNGHSVGGKGQFPPDYKTAWDVMRVYNLAKEHLRFGAQNVLAVRIYDLHGPGGIVDGHVGIYSRLDILRLSIDMSGTWKFTTETGPECTAPDFDDKHWCDLTVPGYWEDQGYPNYDGLACYRKTVTISRSMAHNKLILVLGKINDIDQVYFNGRMIGQTGVFPSETRKAVYSGHSKKKRAYFIPPDLINTTGPNVVAVLVYDIGRFGGIYNGDVGITTREEFLKHERVLNKD